MNPLGTAALAAVVALAGACTSELRPFGRAGAGPPSAPPAPPSAPPPGGADGGEAGSCVAESLEAERLPLDLLLLVDVSSSMSFAAGRATLTKWQMAHDALVGFINDPSTAPLGVGMQFFPVPVTCVRDGDCLPDELCEPRGVCRGPGGGVAALAIPCVPGVPGVCPSSTTCAPLAQCARDQASCTSPGQLCPGADPANVCQAMPRACHLFDEPSASCNPADYRRVAVPVADVAANRTSLARALAAQRPEANIGTPMGPALQGAVDQLRAHLAANPDRRAALVLATDAEAPFCEPSRPGDLAAVVNAARVGSPGNRGFGTYVIGVFTADEVATARPTIEALAAAGGGGAPFVLDPSENITAKLQQALRQIQGAALPCEFKLPPGATMRALDDGRVTARFKGASGEEDVPYVQSADRCQPATGGWHLDVDPKTGGVPTRILACEATCRRFRGDLRTRVELRFACQSP